jgi:hypothetical protein
VDSGTSDDPNPLTCPHCGQRLSYRKTGSAWRRRLHKTAVIETASDVNLYHCGIHGFYVLWPDGRLGHVWNSIRHTDPDDFD